MRNVYGLDIIILQGGGGVTPRSSLHGISMPDINMINVNRMIFWVKVEDKLDYIIICPNIHFGLYLILDMVYILSYHPPPPSWHFYAEYQCEDNDILGQEAKLDYFIIWPDIHFGCTRSLDMEGVRSVSYFECVLLLLSGCK